MRGLRITLAYVAAAFASGVVLQFYLIGLPLFGAPVPFTAHQQLGLLLVPLAALQALLAWVARRAVRPGAAYLVLLLSLLQPVLATVPRATAPAASALHAVAGAVIAVLAFRWLGAAWRGRAAPLPSARGADLAVTAPGRRAAP